MHVIDFLRAVRVAVGPVDGIVCATLSTFQGEELLLVSAQVNDVGRNAVLAMRPGAAGVDPREQERRMVDALRLKVDELRAQSRQTEQAAQMVAEGLDKAAPSAPPPAPATDAAPTQTKIIEFPAPSPN